MKKDKLIVRQARKIEKLKDRVLLLEGSMKHALQHISCIGGPLNDNKLGYTEKQKATFAKIEDCLSVYKL